MNTSKELKEQNVTSSLIFAPISIEEFELDQAHLWSSYQLASTLRRIYRETSLCSEDLFDDYPNLASNPRIRILVIWLEFRIASELTASDDELSFADFQTRFPGDAIALRKLRDFEFKLFETRDARNQELQQLDPRFEWIRTLGQGWFGTVHLAKDLQLDREVAIKTPHPGTPQTAFEQFALEARHAAKLVHPNIVRVYDYKIEKACFIVYEYIEDAVDLNKYLRSNQPSSSQRLTILQQIALALEHAHSAGIVHRDVKPENILIVNDHVWLTDFGLAASDDLLYRTINMQVGTRGYMSPEQMRGELVTSKSDIYSFGRVLKHLFENDRKVPRRLQRLAEACLSQDPQARPTASQCVVSLARLQGDPSGQFWRRVALVSPFLLLLVIALALAWRTSVREAAFQARLSRILIEQPQDDRQQDKLLRDLLTQAEHVSDATRLSRQRPGRLELRKQASELKTQLAALEMRLLPRTKSAQDKLLLAKAIVADADGRYEDALSLLASFNDPTASDLRLRYLQVKGNSSSSLRHWDIASECYQEIATLDPTTNNIILAAQSALNVDDTQYAKSIIDTALTEITALDPRGDISNARNQAALLACLGSVHRLSGDPQYAESCYRKAFAILDDLSKQSDEFKLDRGLALYNIGLLQNESDQATEAEESLSQSAIDLRELSDSSPSNDAIGPLAISLTRLSNTRQRLGKLSLATENATEAVNMLRLLSKSQPELQLELAVALTEKGSCAARGREFEAAMSELKEAERVFRNNSLETTSSQSGLASSLANQVYVFQQIAMHSNSKEVSAEAFQVSDEAVSIFEALRKASRLNRIRTIELARLYINRASMLMTPDPRNVNNAQRALVDLTTAESILEDFVGSELLKANCILNIAIARKAIEPRAALQDFDKAIEAYSKITTTEAREYLALALHNRAICFAQCPQTLDEVKRYFEPAGEDAKKALVIYENLIAEGRDYVTVERDATVLLLNTITEFLSSQK